MNQNAIFFITQLSYRIPSFFGAMVGLFVSIVWMRRCPAAARMVMISCAAITFASVGSFGITVYYYMQRPWTPSQYTRIAVLIATVANLIHSVALVTIILAVFVGRKRDEPLRAFSVEGVFALPATSEHHG